MTSQYAGFGCLHLTDQHNTAPVIAEPEMGGSTAVHRDRHAERWKYEYPEHTSTAFKTIKAGEQSVEVLLLAVHIYTTL